MTVSRQTSRDRSVKLNSMTRRESQQTGAEQMKRQATGYVFGQDEHDRIHAAEDLLDEGTKRLIERCGIAEGGICLEAGAGGGSIAQWLCGLVGATGQVVATDLDVRALARLTEQNLEIRRHDIVADDLEEDHYDLIHARLFLEHLPERDAALAKMVRALRPGGYIVLESIDYVAAVPISDLGAAEHAHTQAVRLEAFAKLGLDVYLGRQLPATLRAHGLIEVGNEGRVFVMEGASPGARWFRLSLAHLRPRLVGPGLLSDAEVDRMLELFDDPNWAAYSPIILGAWGRRR
jgi:2-polyprenyl-3-methyl-5-hydroxy-6-metoxy-1,4-benzoquinol methylase